MINDVAYSLYWAALILVVYNGICFVTWAIISRAYRDRRYRMACVNVVLLLVCFAYVLSLNIYARGLRISNRTGYDDFLSTPSWGVRYLPIIVLLVISSIRLTYWIVDTIRIYLKRRNLGDQWKRRKQ